MFSKRLALLPIVALIALAALPTGASANTGSVKCDSTGVVFSYNANFDVATVSTETASRMRPVWYCCIPPRWVMVAGISRPPRSVR